MFENVNTLWATVFVDELARCGLRAALVAPGSRSTALAFALAAHPDIEDISIIDERCAAFVALGWAQATEQPVLVLATSGTATANFFPAICEADQAAVPLLVVTADRPPQLRDCGDSQAMDQLHLYGGRVRWFHEMAAPDPSPTSLRYLRSSLDEAYVRASGLGGKAGPVHLNVPFSKPLEPTPTPAGPASLEGATGARSGFDAEDPAVLGRDSEDGRAGGRPWTEVALSSATTAKPSAEVLDRLAARLAGAQRPLLFAGALRDGHRLRQALRRLVETLPLPAWVEAASNLRLDPERHPLIIGCADLLLGDHTLGPTLNAAAPDLLIQLGEAPIGWPLRRFLAKLGEEPGSTYRVSLAADGRRADPDHSTDLRLVANPAAVLDALTERLAERLPERLPNRTPRATAAQKNWANLHQQAAKATEAALEAQLAESDELFEGRTFSTLAEVLPEDTALVISSSMPIRDVETFAPRSRNDLEIFANRGLNGIDGVVSTALGVALGRRVPQSSTALKGAAANSRTVVVLGDVAFSHDLGGFAAAARLAQSDQGEALDLTTVVIDNGGGAIFDHLPAAAFEPDFGRLFTTPPELSPIRIAEALRVPVSAPRDPKSLSADLARDMRKSGLQLIVVSVDRESARAQRQAFLQAISSRPKSDRSDRSDRSDESHESHEPATGHGSAVPPMTHEAGQAREATLVDLRPDPAAASRTGFISIRQERKPTWVLLHGFAGAPGDWDEVRSGLGDVRTLVPTLPGHGSRRAPGYFEEAVEGLWDEIDAASLGTFRLAGYSLGGRLALGMALSPRAEGRLDGLVLIAASPGIAELRARQKRLEEDEARARSLEEKGLAAFLDGWSVAPLFAGEERRGHRVQRLRRLRRLVNRSTGLAASLRQLGPAVQPNFTGELAELELPWLYLVGAEDSKYLGIGKSVVDANPAGQLVTVEAAGHSLLIEAPLAVARHLSRWAAEADPESGS